MKKQKFYNKKWFAWIMLVLFAPVGIVLLWTNKHHGKGLRIALTAVFGLMSLVAFASDNEETANVKTEVAYEEETVEQEPTEEEIAAQKAEEEEKRKEEEEAKRLAEEKKKQEAEEKRLAEEKKKAEEEAEQKLLEEVVLDNLKENFKDVGTVKFDAKHKNYQITPTGEGITTDLLLVNNNAEVKKSWDGMVDGIATLSSTMKDTLGAGYSISLINPANTENVLLLVLDGTVVYDAFE